MPRFARSASALAVPQRVEGAEMVIARYASHPMAGNAANDPVTLPAYMALAKDLMAGG